MNESKMSQATPKGYVQTFIIIHLALVAGPIAALLLTVPIPEQWVINLPQENNLFDYLPLILSPGSVFVSELVYKHLTSKYTIQDGLKEKMSQLLTASLIRFAILEGAAFYCFFLNKDSNEHLNIIPGLIPVAVMFIIFPKKGRIRSALKLNREQKTQFMKMNEIIG